MMPSPMDVDGGGERQPEVESNIETLTHQLQKISIKKLADEQKKIKKPVYINTSTLLKFSRSKKSDAD